MNTITEVKTFLCELPVETTTVYGRVFARSSGVVTTFDGTCGSAVATGRSADRGAGGDGRASSASSASSAGVKEQRSAGVRFPPAVQ
ncbi:hypothetical protein CANCADRAFT_4630 [Tortispora caseinolytica NRRL Y-17796]|uniref:Uncharacterized protein n=1 Tax=Tortispora caseinolytica NRRL Y-17796 TaxID=767744 RepID=A0A1E4T9V9_9ASCO|nr:hypothetical protein CANCADRAFT_4630 [Tortispora caseinolytica NRRL Y-17796]